MGRDNSCQSGKPRFATKRDAEKANPGAPVRRCDRCRGYHVDAKRKVTKLEYRDGRPVVSRRKWEEPR